MICVDFFFLNSVLLFSLFKSKICEINDSNEGAEDGGAGFLGDKYIFYVQSE